MKRQLNFRFLGIAILVVVLLGGGAIGMHYFQTKRNAGYLLARGEQAEKDGDTAAATGYYLRYLVFRPDDARAWGRYGLLLADDAKSRREKERAFLTLERALRDDPEQTEVRRRAADLAFELGRFADAKVHIEALPSYQENDPELLELFAQCEAAEGQTTKAAAAFEKAISAAPHRIEPYVQLAAIYRQMDQPNTADQVMDRLAKANPTSSEARLARAKYFRTHGQTETAGQELKAARSGSNQNDPEVMLESADFARSQGKFDEARDFLVRGLELKDSRFQRELARLELQVGNRERAVELLREAATINPDSSNDMLNLADQFLDAGESAAARDLIDRLEQMEGNSPLVQYLRGRLHLSEGKLADAVNLLERVRPEFVRVKDLAVRIDILLAECYDRMGQPDQRLAACRRAAEINPNLALVRLALADALVATGELDEAIVNYQAVITQIPDARLPLARARMWQNLRQPASRRDFSSAIAVLDEAPDQTKQKVEYQLTRADILVAQGKREEARKLMESARDQDPTEVRYWIVLANLAAADRNPDAGLVVLKTASEQVGDQVELRLAQAGLMLRRKPNPADFRSLEKGADALSEADRDRLQLGLAEIYLRAESPADAERLLRLVADRQPNNLVVLTRLLDILITKGDPAEVGELVTRLRNAEQGTAGQDQGVLWRFAEAYQHWLTYRKDPTATTALNQARGQLAEIKKRRPGWSRAPLLEAQIEDVEGNVEAAINNYQLAIQLGARDLNIVRRLVELLGSRRRFDEAQEVINTVANQPAALPEDFRRFAVGLAIIRQDSQEQTLDLIEQAINKDSTDFRDHVLRGQVYANLERIEDAEAAYRRAVSVAPTAPEPRLYLVAFLKRIGQDDKAKREVELASRELPAASRAQILGALYDVIGDRDAAEKHYLAQISATPTDRTAVRGLAMFYITSGEVAKAEQLLTTIIRANPQTTAERRDRQWARRTLALALVSTGDYANGTRAVALINENIREQPGSAEDLRARALILAVRPGSRRQSIQDLEDSFARLRPNPAEEFMLARLYELDGNWVKARDRFEGLLSGPGGRNPSYLAHFIRGLLKQDDLQAAKVWLARLEGLQDKLSVPLTVELRARLAAQQGKKDVAAEGLTAFAQASYKETKNPTVLRNVGLILAELGIPADAEKILKQYVTAAGMKNPAAMLVLVEFLARQNRVSEALQLCSSIASGIGPEAAAMATVAVIRLGEPTAADMTQAEAVILEAARLKPDSLDIQVSLADFRDAQGRYEEAKQIYRSVLARNSRHLMALNNLAWLLALQEKKGDEALRLINTAIETAGPGANLLDTRGVVRLTAGQATMAVEDLTEAVAQEPSPVHYFHLAQAHHQAGNITEARRAMRQGNEHGLTRKLLHPLEGPTFDMLVKELGK
jgi:tetratricopeptide (TPR) repeat protein